ncbi:radical SAM protein [Lentilitoribacter sp. Alg239-R112]|jgi:radical SAM protein with 4Fe4S-binding SPASM domain|uniref:radical SAM/SPASM domain-containing protein n=1 Tax=Lentilitoribacter sp. Alg239-R112 TaxID=2305987 RepID=UPI0013A6DBCE|nr:radical SAM protein [Lentilitoribacter sp. Alg239-R112]
MKAKIEPRIDLNNRTALEAVIPLDTPLTLFVDPSDACNFKCKFCPTSDRSLMKDVGRPWKQMSFELFEKIVDDIKNFPKKVEVLRLYKDGEPLINKRFTDMVKLAKKEKAVNRIDTTTNASLLVPKKAEVLADAGLDRVNISIYGVNSEHYKEFSNVKAEFERIVENVSYFDSISGDCEVLVKISGDHLNDDEKQLFLDTFGNHCDKIYIEHVMSCWPNFEIDDMVNQEFGIYGQPIKEVDVCPYPFYSMSINSDGIVSLCFLDWSRDLIIGDINKESVVDVWQSKKMKNYQKMFLDGKRKKHPICGDCGQMSHGLPDNLDPHKQKILDNLNKVGYFDN